MKKIMAAAAMAALVAGAACAADVTGALKVGTDMFNMNFEDGAKPTVLKSGVESGGYYWGTRLQVGVSTEKAGAQLALSYQSWDNWDKLHCDLYLHDAQVWVKPIDMLKLSILGQGDHLNNSYVDDQRVMHVDGAWKADLTPVEGLTVSATLADKLVDNGDLKDAGLKVAYGADFGTVGAMFIAKDTFKDLRFGAGYSGSFGPVDVFADAAIGLNDGKANNLAFDAQAVVKFEPVTVKAFCLYENTLADSGNAAADNKLLLRAKVEAALDPVTLYLEVKDDDFIADNFKMSVNPGVSFNIGAAGCDFGAVFTIDQNGTSSVKCPFTVSVGF